MHGYLKSSTWYLEFISGDNMTDIDKKLGKRIQELRKRRGMTQQKLAELVNVEVVTISRIENGSRFPKKENIESIADALNVEIKDLFDFENPQTKIFLTNEIARMMKLASCEDLKYIYRLLKLHFETK